MGFAQSMGGQHWAKNGLAAWRHTQHTLPTPAHLVVHTSDGAAAEFGGSRDALYATQCSCALCPPVPGAWDTVPPAPWRTGEPLLCSFQVPVPLSLEWYLPCG